MRFVPLLACLAVAHLAFGATEAKPTLLELAKKKFGDKITVSEKALFVASEQGTKAVADKSDNLVHADRLVWLCTDREASMRLTHRGIDMSGMKIQGNVDMDSAQINFPISAQDCEFVGELWLNNAHVRSISFANSSVRGIDAESVQIDGDVFLQPNFSAGWLNFLDATINGSLECDGGHLSNSNGKALDADGAKIKGRVFLRQGFTAEGEVRFLSATISGDFECDSAKLTNPTGEALNADGAKIEGSIFLRNDFEAEGETNLVDTTINGAADLSHRSRFSNPQGKAINAAGLKVGGELFMGDDLTVEGEARLVDANVGGSLIFRNRADFSNPQGKALSASSINIRGGLFFMNDFASHGEVNFSNAEIGGNVEWADTVEFDNPQGLAFTAQNSKISGEISLTDAKAIGTVSFQDTKIDGAFRCEAVSIDNPQGIALNISGARIPGHLMLRNGFQAVGEVNLIAATIGKDLDGTNARFRNHTGYALSLEDAKIGGNVFFRDQFEVDGRASFEGSSVDGTLQWLNRAQNGTTILDLRSAKVGTVWDDEKSWPDNGNLLLDGFVYDRINAQSPTDAEARLRWLHRQPSAQFLPQPYEQLALVLHNMGYEEESREIRITKNRDHRAFTKRFSQEWWWYNIFGKIIGYGYLPWRALLLSIIVILFGAVVFHRSYHSPSQLILPTDEKGYRKDEHGDYILENKKRTFSPEYPKFNALVYSLEAFIPLIRLEQTSSWAPNASRGKERKGWKWRVTTGGCLRAYLWFHIIAGWILTTLWVGGLTGLVRS